MTVIMDGLLVAATIFAGTYCWVLSRRVRALMDLDKGLGGAITTMTRQIEQAKLALDEAKAAGRGNREELQALIAKADAAAAQLRMLMASQRDIDRPRVRARADSEAAPRTRSVLDELTEEDAPAPRHELGAAERPVPRRAERPLDDDPTPKPRAVVSFDSILRKPLAPKPKGKSSEDEILAALSAMAGPRRS
jgi:hypothetical protein